MSDTVKHNGWSNYATWRVNLEILGDIKWENNIPPTIDYLKEIVEDVVFSQENGDNMLKEDYARAFLNDVNYYEILDNIQDAWYNSKDLKRI